MLALSVALASAACGARLTDQQLNAVRANANSATVPADDSGVALDELPSSQVPLDGGSTDAPGGSTGTNTAGRSTATTGRLSTGGGNTAATVPAGGNGGATDVGVTATSVTVGNVSTLTGPVPGLFAGAAVGAQAFFAYQNSKGGLHGRKFKVDARDDQFDTGQNRAQTIDLIAKAFAFIGSFSLYDDAAVDQIKASNIPDVSHALGLQPRRDPQQLLDPARLRGRPARPVELLQDEVPRARSRPSARVYGDVPSAKALHQGYRAAAESVGYKFLYERGFQATETDFTSDVVRMRDSGVKIVYLLSVDEKTAARFAKAMKSQGFKPEVFAVHGTGYDADVHRARRRAPSRACSIPMTTALYGGEDAAVVPEVALFNQWIQKVKPGFKPDIFTALRRGRRAAARPGDGGGRAQSSRAPP